MGRLRVATFNIHHGAGTDGVVDLQRTAGAITATNADVIGLQELDRGLARSGRVDQARALAELTGLEIAFFPALVRGEGHYGLALGTSKTIALEEVEFHPLPHIPGDEPRGVIVGRIGPLTVFNTHLSKRHPSRRLQLEALRSLALETGGPLLLLGDLNESLRRLGDLATAGFTLPNRPVVTFPLPALRRLGGTVRLGRGIDHILGRGITVTERRAVASRASDHLPLIGQVGDAP